MFDKIKNYFKAEDGDSGHDYGYISYIPLEEVRPNPNQPRKYFDKNAMFELAESIREFGIIQPVTVRKTDDGYELISGERRWRGAYMAGLEVIPCIVIEAGDRRSALLSLLENLQREDLSFFEVAQSYTTLIREQGMTQEEIAYKVGKSRASVADKIRLLKLPPVVRKIIRDYRLSERHAKALLSLSGEEAQLAAVKRIRGGSLNAAQTEELVRSMIREQKQNAASANDPDTAKLFDDAIKRMISAAGRHGITAEYSEREHDWGTEYRIAVLK